MDRLRLAAELSKKQALYKQMLRDRITGPVVERVVEEIAALTRKLYSREQAQ